MLPQHVNTEDCYWYIVYLFFEDYYPASGSQWLQVVYHLNNFQYVVLEIEEEAIGLSRDEILSILWKENILARRYFYPGCHKMEPYRSLFPNASERLPMTERAAKQVLCLPTGTAIGVDDVTKVCDVLKYIVHNADEIGRRLHLTLKESESSF